MSRNELVDLELDIKHETAQAILVHDGVREAWLPLALVVVTLVGDGSSAIVTMPFGLAKDRELV